MGETTGISWTDSTWNPHRGCTRYSPGCVNCYAETLSKRNEETLGKWGVNGSRVLATEHTLHDPQRWNRAASKEGRRRKVFVASLADMFEDWDGQLTNVKGEFAWSSHQRDQLSGLPLVMWDRHSAASLPDSRLNGMTPLGLDYSRLRMFTTIEECFWLDFQLLTKRIENVARMVPTHWLNGHWPKNAWMGVSIESEAMLGRMEDLAELPAPVRWVSAEPLLSAIDFTPWLERKAIDWMVVGGESGFNARPMKLEWMRDIQAQCRKAGVAVWNKQKGEVLARALGCKDRAGTDPNEWPEDLRVQEFPQTTASAA